jgi:hypothetical protein
MRGRHPAALQRRSERLGRTRDLPHQVRLQPSDQALRARLSGIQPDLLDALEGLHGAFGEVELGGREILAQMLEARRAGDQQNVGRAPQ